MKFPAAHVFVVARASIAEESKLRQHGPPAGNFLSRPAPSTRAGLTFFRHRLPAGSAKVLPMVSSASAGRDDFRARAHEQFGHFLAGKGLRYTDERQAVVGAVFA